MNSENKIIENKGSNIILYSIVGVIFLTTLYTIHTINLKLSSTVEESYINFLLTTISSSFGGGMYSHAFLPLILILLIVIFKIIIEKTSNIGGYAGKVSSFLSKKVLTLASNFFLILVTLFSALMVYSKYKLITGYQIFGGNFIVDCIMIVSLLILIFTKKYN